jgi:hypothetical protein
MSIDIQPYKTGPHPAGSGEQRLYRFDNGFGASVVRFMTGGMAGSYGAEAGLWELAVLKFETAADNFELTYDTDITDDVIGRLSAAEVDALLVRIRDLDENGRES